MLPRLPPGCPLTRALAGPILRASAPLLLALVTLSAPHASGYDYPVRDALLATVVGTAAADAHPVPSRVRTRIRRLQRFPDREIPSSFWDQDELRYSVSAQRRAAPLIFIIAGTGANHRSGKMLFLRRLFFSEGYHVIALSSPTHPNFILTASALGHPGFTPEDAEDLYVAMKEAYTDLASRVEISEVHLTGYSLGGTQSAFLMAIDDQEQVFHFKRVLMINPSVDLFSSVRTLDELFSYALPDGNESVVELVERLLKEVSAFTHENGRRSVDDELLYRLAEQRIAEGRPPTQRGLAGMIAGAFRLSAANMFFTVDTLNGEGHIVERADELRPGSSLTPYFRRSMEWSFERYFDQILLPYWQSIAPDLTRESLIEQASLRSLHAMLSRDPRIGAMTNADDFILNSADLDFLRTSLGDRLKVYPVGGHCGNLTYHENVEHMLRFFEGATP